MRLKPLGAAAAAFVIGVAAGAFVYRAHAIRREQAKVVNTYGESGADLALRDALDREASRGHADVALLGDSLFEYWRFYPDVFDRHFAGLRVANLAVGGDCSGNTLWQASRGLLRQCRPRVAVVLTGTNDLWVRSPEQIGSDVASVVKAILAECDAKVIVVGILPRGNDPMSGAKRQRANPLIRAAVEAQGALFVDAGPSLAGADGHILPACTTDGIHLTGEGYDRLGAVVAKAVNDATRAAVP